MGIDYRSHVIVGCKVDITKIKIAKKVRGCECKNMLDAGDNYCSSCGSPAWEDDYDTIPGFDDSGNYETLHGYRMITTGYRDDELDIEKECWIAIRHKQTRGMFEHVKLETPDDIGTLREKLKRVLGPIGLWDEKQFGVWAIQETW